jgi:PhzF family phenazine biosynthesis protein
MQKIWVVDAFADKPFAGNPAGVCLGEAPFDERWMQQVAAEMKHAETSFVYPVENGFSLRWFTPFVEMPLCGHATLAAAHVIWEAKVRPANEQLRFHTRSGELLASRLPDGWIELDFPKLEPGPAGETGDVEQALGAKALEVRRYGIKLVVRLENEQTVRKLSPNIALIARLNTKGVVVTARSQGGPYDFVSRFFAPALGVDEDPVTGSAHCALAPYWMEKLGKDTMLAYQASPRGGVMRVQVVGNRVRLGGQAITTLQGNLKV